VLALVRAYLENLLLIIYEVQPLLLQKVILSSSWILNRKACREEVKVMARALIGVVAMRRRCGGLSTLAHS
jgi:hypothetical protein